MYDASHDRQEMQKVENKKCFSLHIFSFLNGDIE